ncbi:hypothetical protein K435DRAFT_973721 [Dendrothele bispora CBS 962.96]|uniref:Zn(2)-C6 fungal-type domain-containing protein n=1 Tax=Dendrothele bispora (strain CBS 962.96) TaxID=1314807 RepID=A0A4S8KQH1_DENBC|nr:hypothetical protein K435DRAFT_973721 [Dendrothele bispora CBS 962.96]
MLQGSSVDGSGEAEHRRTKEASSSLTSSVDARSKRRFPKSLRRRTEVSCDRCKIRKIRCIRSPGKKRPCTACTRAGETRESTLPRKQRVYASVDQLSLRYRMLDHLVRQLFPDRNLGTLKSLATPDILKHFQSTPPSGPLSSRSVLTPTASVPGVSKIPEGRLIPTPRRGFHYVGPVSSFYFTNIVRQLVSKPRLGTMKTFGEAGFNLKRYFKATEFTSFRISQALEARIRLPMLLRMNTRPWRDRLRVYSVGNIGLFWIFYQNGPSLTDSWTRFLNAFIPTSQYSTRKHSSSDPGPGWVCALMMTLVLGAQTLEDTTTSSSSHSVFLTLTQTQSIQQTYLTHVIKDGLSRHSSNRKTSQTSQALMLLSLYQQQRRRTKRSLDVTRLSFQNRSRFRSSITDLTDVSVTLPEDTFVDREEDVPERYLEYAVGLTRISSAGEDGENGLSRECEAWERVIAGVGGVEEWTSGAFDVWAEDRRDDDGYSTTWRRRHHRRAIGVLHVLWDHVRSILGRPFLLCKVNHSIEVTQNHNGSSLPEPIANLAAESLRSAKSVLGILAELGRYQLLEGLVGRLNAAAAVSANDGEQGQLEGQDLDGENGIEVAVGERMHAEEDLDMKMVLKEVLTISQRIRLAPAYRILMNAAMQFGLGLEEMETATAPQNPQEREESWNLNILKVKEDPRKRAGD